MSPSQLCEFCKDLSIERLLRFIRSQPEYNKYRFSFCTFPHQPSVGALRQSAENGCGFCRFMTDCFDTAKPRTSLYKSAHDPESPVLLGLRPRLYNRKRGNFRDHYIVQHLYISFDKYLNGGRYKFNLYAPSERSITLDDTPSIEIPSFRIGRPKLDPDLGSSAIFNIARNWLRECQQNHLACLHDSMPVLPTRVIDVGTSENLVEPHIFISGGMRAHYIALSHCWGGEIATSLRTTTLSAYRTALPSTELPQNFRDAITITRELGFRYLWVDSLCIIQDSQQDWASESAKMGSVYQDSAVTISAMAPANSNVGILKSYEPLPRLAHKLRVYEDEESSDELTVEFIHPSCKGIETLEDLWHDSPLASRGWTLQELVLSPRHLLYGRRQIYWKCPDGFQSAEEGASYHDELSVYPKELACILHRDRLLSSPVAMPDQKKLLREFYRLVQDYSRRKLSKPSDKFPAFSGIVAGLLPVLGGDYIAGIWTCDFANGLLWKRGLSYVPPDPYGPVSCKDASAPSWSWAATPCVVEYDFHDFPPTQWQVRLLSHRIVPVDSLNPLGQVESARLVVEGFIIPLISTAPGTESSQLVKIADVQLTQYIKDQGIIHLYQPVLATESSGITGTADAMPHESKEIPPSGTALLRVEDLIGDGYCVLLVRIGTDNRFYRAKRLAFGLMLRPVLSEVGGVYERIGYVKFYHVRRRWLQTLESRVVTLV